MATAGKTPAVVSTRSGRPRILYVTPYWPLPPTCASELRSLHIARALKEMGTVEMVVVDAEGGAEKHAALREPEFKVHYGVPVQPKPNVTPADKLAWLFNPRTVYPHGCGVDADALARVKQTAAEFDLVWFSKLRTPNMFPQWAWPRCAADIDDVPSTYEKSVLDQAHGLKARALAALRLRSWKRRDQLLAERFSVLGVCSEPDRQYLHSLGVRAPLHVIPNGFARPLRVPVRQPATPPRIGFIGIFDYAPNIEGARWFVQECWPAIKQAIPDAHLRLVGRHTDTLKPAGVDIDGLGFVPDVDEEISTWSAMIVPVQLGAGTRGKIAQAFSLKCPVVSTTLGAHGYEPRHRHDMLLADSASDFAAACVEAVRKPDEAAAMAERAWEQFLQKWTWEAIRPRVWEAAEECLRLNRDAHPAQR